MSDDEGDTNAQYYSHLWTKPIKVRSAAKRVKHKRSQKAVRLGNLSVCLVEHLRRLHHKRVNARLRPLLGR